jgi:hypothetical protein
MLMLMTNDLSAQNLRVTTSQYNNMRTGANLNETVLTSETVNARQFGKVRSIPVDGAVYAQPLYLSHVDVPGKGIHDLLFVATERDSVYAFDANGNSTEPIWQVSLLPTKDGPSFPVPAADVQCPFISPAVGITSTPVIDAETGTIFVLARSSARANILAGPRYSQQLHALAVTTGREKFGGPVEIRASVSGTGEGSSGGQVQFDALRENPRAALLLTKGAVYLTWASSCDVSPYHGWVMAYDARTLQQLGVLNTSPNAGESGIWQSDTGPAADEQGNVYVSTGNGLFDAAAGGGRDYGDSMLKLRLKGHQLLVADFFTPENQQELNSDDGDLGSGGPLLVPAKSGTDVAGLVFGGKQGVLYDINPNRMGGAQRQSTSPEVESFRLSNGIYSAPAYWNGHLYTFASEDWLKQFTVTNGRVASAYSSRSKQESLFSGGTPTISANGNRNAVVWIVETRAWNAAGTQAVLRAYDALNVAKQLYSSDENPTRDQASEAVRFAIPTVINGRVYVGGVKAITVYGLLAH